MYLLAVFLLGFSVFLLSPEKISSTEYAVSVSCARGGQQCDREFHTEISTRDILRVKFDVAEGHCSPIKVSILVDGKQRSSSMWLAWPEYAVSIQEPRVLSTDYINLQPVSWGRHIISIRAEGYPIGCNTGDLVSWGGTLTVQTNKKYFLF